MEVTFERAVQRLADKAGEGSGEASARRTTTTASPRRRSDADAAPSSAPAEGRPAAAGLFVTFEGGDGVGKTTQAALLEEWLTDAGRTVVRTREPGGTEVGLLIRDIVLHHRGEVAPRAEALLYAADRAHHIETLVRPALARARS